MHQREKERAADTLSVSIVAGPRATCGAGPDWSPRPFIPFLFLFPFSFFLISKLFQIILQN
jgi:hypothetical protein